MITDLDLEKREVSLSVKAAQVYEEKSLVAKFGVNAAKSGATLAGIFQKALGKKQVVEMQAVTGAEDFSAFQEKVPGFYFYLGGLIKGNKSEDAPSHHTPEFMVDDASLIYGVKAMVQLSLDYLY